jgi:hypothetical protein
MVTTVERRFLQNTNAQNLYSFNVLMPPLTHMLPLRTLLSGLKHQMITKRLELEL